MHHVLAQLRGELAAEDQDQDLGQNGGTCAERFFVFLPSVLTKGSGGRFRCTVIQRVMETLNVVCPGGSAVQASRISRVNSKSSA